jgi:4-hydroxybenzoate polyprenyltransferase
MAVESMSQAVRQMRWAAGCVLLAVLCAANEHAPPGGEDWWWVLLFGLVGVAAGRLDPRDALRWSLLLLVGLALSALLIEPTIALWGMAMVPPIPWLVGGFRLQHLHTAPPRP